MNIGLVLSGGMAKGAFQIGALKAIANYIPSNEIKYMSCASIGVLNGYAYATQNLDKAEHMWRSVCNKDARLLVNQILKSSMLQQRITEIYDPQNTLSSKFYCSLLDINHRNIVYKDLSTVSQDQIPLYLKASVAMPVYNRAVHIDKISYFDGAMVDNIPVFPLLKHNLDYLICIYFDNSNYMFENTYFDNKIIKLTFPSSSVLKQSIVVEEDSITSMIKSGYDTSMHLLDSVLGEGYDNIESIYHKIELINKQKKSPRIRITGDFMVTHLNKVTQRLTKKKIL